MGLSHLTISLLLSVYAPPQFGYHALAISSMPVPRTVVKAAPELTLTRLAKMSDAEIEQFGREHGLYLRRQDLFCKTAPYPKLPRKQRPAAVAEGQPKLVEASSPASPQAPDCESPSAP